MMACSETGVPAYRAKSKLHGFGLFAQRDLRRGQRIIQYIGKKIKKDDCEKIHYRRVKSRRGSNRGIVYLFKVRSGHFIDGLMSRNTARFINHSCNPNCESYVYRRKVWIRALRKIAAGKELTYDYGFDIEDGLSSPCSCQEKQCVGFIIGKAFRSRFKRGKHLAPRS